MDRVLVWANVTPVWWLHATAEEIGGAVFAARSQVPEAQVKVTLFAIKVLIVVEADEHVRSYVDMRERARAAVKGVRAARAV